MPFFGLIWVTAWISCLATFSQNRLKVPDYIATVFPPRVFSVVNSSIEGPKERVFRTQLDSRSGTSNSSIATVRNVSFPSSTVRFQSQVASRVKNPTTGSNTRKNSLCGIDSEFPLSAWGERPATDVSKKTLPEKIVGVIQNLFPWRQQSGSRENTSTNSILVVSTHTQERVSEKSNREGRYLKRGFWQYSQMLKTQAFGSSSPTHPAQFQVWMKGQLIAEFPRKQQAEQMAEQLRKFFCQPFDSKGGSSVEAVFFHGLPAVKVGDRLLLKLDDTLVKTVDINRELLAIEWANNLRIALGQEALNLTDAQKRMHNLVETSTIFEGLASWYGSYFHGKVTATGETYREHELTAAHPSLPFDTYVKVSNQDNGHSVIVRINDRGPYVPGRTLDLSRQAARSIKSEKAGIIPFEAVIMQSSSAQSYR